MSILDFLRKAINKLITSVAARELDFCFIFFAIFHTKNSDVTQYYK